MSSSVLFDEVTDSMTVERWKNVKKNALLWRGLDKFGEVYDTVEWDEGPVGQHVHDTCRLNLCNTKKLEQANKRQKKREVDECQPQSSSMSDVCPPTAAPAAKRLRSSLGLIHEKTKCVWCCKTETTKHPDKLKLI